MQFVLASNNQKKLLEMRQILANEGCTVISMAEAGFHTDPAETGTTFEENARIKARAAMEACGQPCIADDSGLEVDALGGAPGVYSARYCPGTDLDRVEYLLHNMENQENRAARFVSAVACVFPDGGEIVVRGECRGVLLREMQGEGGFGYDPVFYVPGEGCTFAEMPQARKNQISHRAAAMTAFCAALRRSGRLEAQV
ncbi:MAG: RdgB/HAM1 family non-canonical purine NTP pyrophosphatase [Clostridia bacterium]|nr:RdgB/HAM1 family non-canonical purine NTP pyrophosphatase [Clostridia bacterium]